MCRFTKAFIGDLIANPPAGIPIVQCHPHRDGRHVITDKCPYCGGCHQHALTDEPHRASHCQPPAWLSGTLLRQWESVARRGYRLHMTKEIGAA